VPYHLDYATLFDHPDKLDCGRIVLTHMSHHMLARQADASFELAHDGLVVDV
jgi:hypothetical protein